jgi:spermidine synthase
MREPIAAAHGKVLVLGLGLGYYPFMISMKDEVESIVIVELQQSIADIFNAHILPHFKHKDKIKVVTADAIAYMEDVKDGDFDFCFADIWEGAVDGAEAYQKLRPYEKKLPHTKFTYWIEAQIKAYLEE